MRSIFCKIFLALSLLIALPTHAQINSYIQDDNMTRYMDMVDTLFNSQPDAEYDFTQLRGIYTRIDLYDPTAVDALDALDELTAALNNNDLSEVKVLQLRSAYFTLLKQHAGNIDVMKAAALNSRLNTHLGSPVFFDWVIEGLTRSVLQSGDGSSLINSYNILTLGEENAVLEALQLDITERDNQKSGATYYGIYEGYHRTSKLKQTLFVDLSTPMRYLEKQMKASVFKAPLGGQ